MATLDSGSTTLGPYTLGDYAIFGSGQLGQLAIFRLGDQDGNPPAYEAMISLESTVQITTSDNAVTLQTVDSEEVNPPSETFIIHEIKNNNHFIGFEIHNSSKSVNAIGVLISDILDSDPTRTTFLSAPLNATVNDQNGESQEILGVRLTQLPGQDMVMKVYYSPA